MRLALHPRHRVVILVGRLDRSVVRAIRYARSVDALDVTALHVGVDPVLAHRLLEEWWRFGRTLETPLEIQESLDRNIPRVVRDYVAPFVPRPPMSRWCFPETITLGYSSDCCTTEPVAVFRKRYGMSREYISLWCPISSLLKPALAIAEIKRWNRSGDSQPIHGPGESLPNR
jgi:hypothetical protein